DLVHVLRLDAGLDQLAARAQKRLLIRLGNAAVCGGRRAVDAVRTANLWISRATLSCARPDLPVEHLAAERAIVDVHRDRLVEATPVAVDLRPAFLRRVVDD